MKTSLLPIIWVEKTKAQGDKLAPKIMEQGNNRAEVWSQVCWPLKFFPSHFCWLKRQRNSLKKKASWLNFWHRLSTVVLLTRTQHLGYFWSFEGLTDKSVNSLEGDWLGEQNLFCRRSQLQTCSGLPYMRHTYERLQEITYESGVLKAPWEYLWKLMTLKNIAFQIKIEK